MKRSPLILLNLFVLLSVFVWSSTYGAVIIIPDDITVVPNNDDLTGLNNPNNNTEHDLGIRWLVYYEDCWSSNEYDIENSGGTTEYLLSETVTNSTGIDWIGYNFELYLNPNYSGFIPSGPDDGFDFDAPVAFADPIPTSSTSLSLNHTSDGLYWSGLIPDGSTVTFSYSIDIPDSLGVDTIYIREFPSVSTPVPIPKAMPWIPLLLLDD